MYGETTYGNNSRTTATDVGPVPSGANMSGIYDLFRKMIQARTAAPKPASGGLLAARPAAASYGSPAPQSRPTESAYDPLAHLKRSAEAAQLQALINPAPTRPTTFASNAINGYTLDPQAMTGAQRQLFLPNNAVPGAFPLTE